MDEWGRLDRHRTEFAVTLRVLEEFLPTPPAIVLDIGGGPGRYALELSKRGYTVTLIDLSEECLRLAKIKSEEVGVKIESFQRADAQDLRGTKSSHYDAVLLMGPLYHLPDLEQRRQAASEAARVLKPRGRIFAALITRFAPFRDSVSKDPAWYIKNKAYALQIRRRESTIRARDFQTLISLLLKKWPLLWRTAAFKRCS